MQPFQWYIQKERLHLFLAEPDRRKSKYVHDLLLRGESKVLQTPEPNAPEEAHADYRRQLNSLEQSNQWVRIEQNLARLNVEDAECIGESYRMTDPSAQCILSVRVDQSESPTFLVKKNRFQP